LGNAPSALRRGTLENVMTRVRDIQEMVRRYRVEDEYYAAEAISAGIVAAVNGIAWAAAWLRNMWKAPRDRVDPQAKRPLASS